MRYVITCLVTRNTLLPRVVLACLLVVFSYPPVVIVYTFVVFVCPFVCPLRSTRLSTLVSVCSLLVLVVLSVRLFITNLNEIQKQPLACVLQNLAIFTGKHLYWSLLSIKYFHVNITKFLRTVFLKRTTPVAVSGNSKLLYKIVAQSHIAKNCRKSEPI